MKKYIISMIMAFVIGVIGTLVVCFNYSDYRTDAVVKHWGVNLTHYLNNPNQKFNPSMDDFPYLETVDYHENFIMLKGYNQTALLIFYKDELNHWKCITNTKLKKVAHYDCQ